MTRFLIVEGEHGLVEVDDVAFGRGKVTVTRAEREMRPLTAVANPVCVQGAPPSRIKLEMLLELGVGDTAQIVRPRMPIAKDDWCQTVQGPDPAAAEMGTEPGLAEENARLRAHVEELTDRVIAAETGRTDAADLQRELDEMRRTWADAPTTEDAIAKLRAWIPDYEAGATMVAMPVAMARKLLAALEAPDEDEEYWDAVASQARGEALAGEQ
jgi:hypothetical protein